TPSSHRPEPRRLPPRPRPRPLRVARPPQKRRRFPPSSLRDRRLRAASAPLSHPGSCPLSPWLLLLLSGISRTLNRGSEGLFHFLYELSGTKLVGLDCLAQRYRQIARQRIERRRDALRRSVQQEHDLADDLIF